MGDARRDFATLHRFAVYDCELDGTRSAGENADALRAAWRRRARPSVFERMRSAR